MAKSIQVWDGSTWQNVAPLLPTVTSQFIQLTNASTVGYILRGASGQTADYLQVQNYASNPIFKVDNSGNLTTVGSLTIGNNNGSGTSYRLNLAGSDLNHSIYSTGSGGNNMFFNEYNNFVWYNTQNSATVMNLNSSGVLNTSGTIIAGSGVGGQARLEVQGSAGSSGYVSFWDSAGSSRQGYIGAATTAGNGTFSIWSENSTNSIQFGTNSIQRMWIGSDGNVNIGGNGGTSNAVNGLRYFDVFNTDSNSGSGAIIRLITQQSSSTSSTTVDLVKYKNGNFVIANNDSNAYTYLNTAGTTRMVITNNGNIGIGLNSQSNIYPANQATVEVNITQGGQSAMWLKNYAGSGSSPSEVTDWPMPVLGLTSYGNFYLQTMLNFGLPNDALYHTDDSIWNFKLNGVTQTGWDNNGNTTPVNSSAGNGGGPVGLQLLGPGNLRIGSAAAYSIFFRTNGSDNVMINSSGYLMAGYSTSQGSYRLQVNGVSFLQGGYTTSDIKYKENISPLKGGLEIVKALKPVEFNWKDQEHVTDEDGKVIREKHEFIEGRDLGFIAQDMEEAFKDKEWLSTIVRKNTREAVKDNFGNVLVEEEDFLGVSHNHIIALLVSAVQELSAEVEALKKKK